MAMQTFEALLSPNRLPDSAVAAQNHKTVESSYFRDDSIEDDPVDEGGSRGKSKLKGSSVPITEAILPRRALLTN